MLYEGLNCISILIIENDIAKLLYKKKWLNLTLLLQPQQNDNQNFRMPFIIALKKRRYL